MALFLFWVALACGAILAAGSFCIVCDPRYDNSKRHQRYAFIFAMIAIVIGMAAIYNKPF